MTSEQTLFDYVLVISNPNGTPQVSYRFPTVTTNPKNDVTQAAIIFCFPEEGSFSQSCVSEDKETFSFVLTGSDGSKRFGYCRRFLTSDNLVECYCIVSCFSSFSLFSMILDIVEERRAHGSSHVFSFLKSVLAKQCPLPGETITISTFSKTEKPDIYELSRLGSNESILEYVSYSTYFQCLSIKNIIQIFECILLERRCVFVSSSLSRLSTCINAATALVDPFSWQYIYIPILPKSLLSYCCAPMPFIVGIVSSMLPELRKQPHEEILLVDCDADKLVQIPEDSQFLSDAMRNKLKNDLTTIKNNCHKVKKAFDINVSRCFTHFLWTLVGDYFKYFFRGSFDTVNFLEGQNPATISMVNTILQSQMWDCFVTEREAMWKSDLLKQCVFQREEIDPWTVTDLSVHCFECAVSVNASDIKTSRGRPFCPSCYALKKTKLFGRKKSKTTEEPSGSKTPSGSLGSSSSSSSSGASVRLKKNSLSESSLAGASDVSSSSSSSASPPEEKEEKKKRKGLLSFRSKSTVSRSDGADSSTPSAGQTQSSSELGGSAPATGGYKLKSPEFTKIGVASQSSSSLPLTSMEASRRERSLSSKASGSAITKSRTTDDPLSTKKMSKSKSHIVFPSSPSSSASKSSPVAPLSSVPSPSPSSSPLSPKSSAASEGSKTARKFSNGTNPKIDLSGLGSAPSSGQPSSLSARASTSSTSSSTPSSPFASAAKHKTTITSSSSSYSLSSTPSSPAPTKSGSPFASPPTMTKAGSGSKITTPKSPITSTPAKPSTPWQPPTATSATTSTSAAAFRPTSTFGAAKPVEVPAKSFVCPSCKHDHPKAFQFCRSCGKKSDPVVSRPRGNSD